MRSVRLSSLVLTLLTAVPTAAAAQIADAELDTATVVADSSDLRSLARSAQSRFERLRYRHLPVTLSFVGGECDERVGRFCTWYGEGEWYPEPEAEEIVLLRRLLLAELDSIQSHLPGDAWVLGQRVWYRAEGGDWAGARRTAQACGDVEPWWCSALLGFSLHGEGRYPEAEEAFAEALAAMGPGRREEWRFPERALAPSARGVVRDAFEASPDSGQSALDRLWRMADPLFLAPGNDRLTAHYARWTVSEIRDEARNPFRIRWGGDLEELTVRHGWELGWERSRGRVSVEQDNVVGHKHPEGRDYLPDGDALRSPALAAPEALEANRDRPRSLYAPTYAPVLLPMEAQIALFPRPIGAVVVATQYLPADTTFHSGHDHALPWMEPGDQAGMADRIGLFLDPLDGRAGERIVREGTGEGALHATLPEGGYLLSSESWSPNRRRAGRDRRGIVAREAIPDVAALSDILMLAPMVVEPETLEDAVVAALPRTSLRPGQPLAIAWEVAGLGFRYETLSFELSVYRAEVGFFRRIGEALRISDRDRPLGLSWEEPSPLEPRTMFRYVDLELPVIDPGTYEIRLTLRIPERSDVTTVRRFRVLERDER